MDSMKLWAVKITPSVLLKLLWKCGIVERTTIFRWEMSLFLWKWDDGSAREVEDGN